MPVLDAFTKGVAAGLILAMMIGPVFFTLLQQSLKAGYKSALPMIVGISISDSMYILICLFGISKFVQNTTFQIWMSIIGGCIMLIFGLINIFKSGRKNQALEPTNSKQGVLKRFFRGLVINGLNPMVLVFWIGMVTVSKVKFTADDGQIYIFLFSIVITVFITDNIKAFLAEKLSALINAKYIRVLNTLVGIGFILFSIKLFHYGYEIGFSQAME